MSGIKVAVQGKLILSSGYCLRGISHVHKHFFSLSKNMQTGQLDTLRLLLGVNIQYVCKEPCNGLAS